MHFPTPHLKKSEKRKASIDSVGAGHDGAALERKGTRKERRAKRAKGEEEGERGMSSPVVSEDEAIGIERTTSPLTITSTTSSQISPATTRKDSAQDAPPTHIPTTTAPHTSDEEETPQPRRSSRIRNSMHTVANTWTKARPYLERLNGTIMPLQPQGTGAEAYYARERGRGD